MRTVVWVIFFFVSTVVNLAAAQNANYTSLLKDFVHDGKVNYGELCKDPRLPKYISELNSTDPEKLKDTKERLAFWFNAYNAYTIKVICDHYPIKSINDLHSGGRIVGAVLKTTIWDKDFVQINNKAMTLNQIEHKIIRPVFKEPRAHFALVCASKSCPALRPEAYEGSKLEQQLNEDARIFLADPTRNRFDAQNRKANLSKIFDWYGDDFGTSDSEILVFLAKFLPDQTASSIRSDPQGWKVDHLDYDWSLNE